jgi:hypothetical protein
VLTFGDTRSTAVYNHSQTATKLPTWDVKIHISERSCVRSEDGNQQYNASEKGSTEEITEGTE